MLELTSKPLSSLSAALVLYHSDLANLRATLSSLALSATPILNRVFVVDQSCDPNYSDVAEVLCEEIATEFQLTLEFIRREVNGGYGAGQNVVLDRSLGDFHLILNPDVELDLAAIKQGLSSMVMDSSVVAVAPRATNSKGEEQFLAKSHPSVLVLLLRAFAPSWLKLLFTKSLACYELRSLPAKGEPSEIYLMSGCCMLVRAEALRSVGGFDERYFLYFEDYDLTRRLAQVGKVVRVHTMHIVHHGGNAASKGWQHVYWLGRSALRFFGRWGWRFI